MVLLAKNFSEHNAAMAGLRFATGSRVVIMDDDLAQYLGRMFLKIGGEPQLVVREVLNASPEKP